MGTRRGAGGAAARDGLDQRGKHAGDSLEKCPRFADVVAGQEAESDAQFQLGFQFRDGAGGDPEVARIVFAGALGMSLGDVGRDGDRGPMHLRNQREPLGVGEALGEFENDLHQPHRGLPDLQIPIAAREAIHVRQD